ncbi:nucleotide exchange factor GrpE [Dolichospermum planctonicum CS-1226]|uniref:Protein GrpE n=1 Tax=Dolichospermum planctonicum CS-1226 TaxID=3021751 RepID=A0ABT5AD29_9CYAN|nr:nucleotide exchange factor GrpE [Dolichospermum planctonicum]MDB9534804.1 nucleotide exchange factor GrpE [Dolichospermum planctonicum CS-1226]
MKSEFPSEINPNEPGHEVNEQAGEQFQQFNQPQDILMTEEIDQDRSQNVEINIAALSALTGQIESLKVQLEERNTQYMRIAADFENYRKRTSKEKEEIDLQVKRNTITELLPVVDNFERARSHLKPQSEGEMTIHKSYQGVYKQLVDCLKRLGVAPMRPEGQLFDPNLHEAVMREATDEHPEGTVLEELVRGYYFGDRVLRHAMVKVAAPKEDVSSSPEDSV